MTITAKVIADSISDKEHRLTTFSLKYPRFIHSEFMTHRVFSRNASSSRAIPVNKLLQDVRENPAMPIEWGLNKAGMQAENEHEDGDLCRDIWITASRIATDQAALLNSLGLHKQIVNRVIEPFSHISVVCTATEYANFYNLRNHPDAQPEIKRLSEVMLEAHRASKPRLREPQQWHLPYILPEEDEQYGNPVLRKVSVARCARVSYLTHEGKTPDIEKDLKLHDFLLESKHMSPFEHQATPINWVEDGPDHQEGNLIGWNQYRKSIDGENQNNYEI